MSAVQYCTVLYSTVHLLLERLLTDRSLHVVEAVNSTVVCRTVQYRTVLYSAVL